jgi:hypothetical protein
MKSTGRFTMDTKNRVGRLALMLLTALLAVSCGKPAADAGRAAEKADAGSQPFELVSIERVDSQQSNSAAGNTVYWEKDGPDSGVLIILKMKTPETLESYSSDFSLGYVAEAGIPRSACVGISLGVATPDQVQLSTWMLAGSMSRSWVRPEKPYFGVLFGVPRTVDRVTLYYAAPLLKDLELAATGVAEEKP